MKTLFIINPRAGRGSALRTWKQIEHYVAGDRQAEVVMPDSAAGTRKAAADAVRAGCERVVAVGGDGTLLTVADELAQTDTVAAIIPAGTGNDFVRDYGMPRRPEEALSVALGPHTRQVDLGHTVGGRHFLNAAGIGFDAEAAAVAASFPKGLGGTLPYLLGAVQTLIRLRHVEVDVTVDDQQFRGPITMMAVANGRYYGGGMQIAPYATRDDGLLDVILADALSRGELLRLLPAIYSGGHLKSPKVHCLRGRQVRVQVTEPIRAHVDGDPLLWDALHFEARPRALTVAMPADAADVGRQENVSGR